MWELDYKDSWSLKNWCFWTVVLEKTLESPLDFKVQPVRPKGNQSWIFIGRTDAMLKLQMLRPPNVKNWLIWKDPDAGKDWKREEKMRTEDDRVGWHHRLNGHEFESTPGVGDGQGSLACFSPWGCSLTRLKDWTEDSNTLALFPTSSHKFSWVECSLLLYNSRCFPLPLPPLPDTFREFNTLYIKT